MSFAFLAALSVSAPTPESFSSSASGTPASAPDSTASGAAPAPKIDVDAAMEVMIEQSAKLDTSDLSTTSRGLGTSQFSAGISLEAEAPLPPFCMVGANKTDCGVGSVVKGPCSIGELANAGAIEGGAGMPLLLDVLYSCPGTEASWAIFCGPGGSIDSDASVAERLEYSWSQVEGLEGLGFYTYDGVYHICQQKSSNPILPPGFGR